MRSIGTVNRDSLARERVGSGGLAQNADLMARNI
jgi:hypothetical protein